MAPIDGRRHRARIAAVIVGTILALSTGAAPVIADIASGDVAPDLQPHPAAWRALVDDGIEASAWGLFDATTGQLIAGRAPDERRAPASTLKILTALTVVSWSDPAERVGVGDEVTGAIGAGVGLRPGDEWSVGELLDALIARSGNDAALALAVHVGGSIPRFVALMHLEARSHGLDAGIVLHDPAGLDDENRLSVRDLAVLAGAALADDRLAPRLAAARVSLPRIGVVASRNEFLADYPDATGVKTGFTAQAGNSLVASATRDDRDLIAVVLDAGDDPARFEQARRLLDAGFTHTRVETIRVDARLAVGGGEALISIGPHPVVSPLGTDVLIDVALPPRTGDVPSRAVVRAGDSTLGTLPVSVESTTRNATVGEGEPGPAIADALYVALRAASTAGMLR